MFTSNYETRQPSHWAMKSLHTMIVTLTSGGGISIVDCGSLDAVAAKFDIACLQPCKWLDNS